MQRNYRFFFVPCNEITGFWNLITLLWQPLAPTFASSLFRTNESKEQTPTKWTDTK